jgi:hypothetical protein
MRALTLVVSLFAAGAALVGCDRQRIERLQAGVSTEADVRAEFGEPETVWMGAGGERTLEYNRQPEGRTNFMVTIGADGRMTALRQVLEPATFRQVAPGMTADEVRRMLGRPAKVTPYGLRNQVAWDWRYTQPPNTPMVFTVWFGPDNRVVSADSGPDPSAPENR